MTPTARAIVRGVVIAVAAAVTLASTFTFRSGDWPIYLVFVVLGLLVHLPAVEVLPHVPLPVAELVLNIAFLYIAGPAILILRYVVPLVLAAIPGSIRTRLNVRLFGASVTAETTSVALAADWSSWTLGLGARWCVVLAVGAQADPTGHPGVMLLAEVVGYATSGLLALLPIYSFRPFLGRSHGTPVHLLEDLGLVMWLTVTPFVFLVVYGYRAHGLAGATVWSLAALGLHFVMRRLNERRLQLEVQNRKLERLQHELAHRERLSAIGKMSSVVSHQILQQLGVIGLYADLIRNAPDDGDPTQQLARMRAGADAIEHALASVNGVLRDLLVFGKDQRLNLYEHSLSAVVGEAIESCRAAAQERGAVMRVAVARDVRLSLDKLKITQALTNLLRNAIDASPPGAEVVVHAGAVDDGVEVSVADRGAGVAAAEREAIFAPFFTTKEQGTGLGLAIAREFARAHGGDLRIAEDGRPGTTFVLRLPAAGVGTAARASSV